MKIILTVHQFFPEYRSGTEVLTYSVAKELQRLGHDVKVFTGYPAAKSVPLNERFDRYVHDGIEVFRYNHTYEPLPGQKVIMELDYNNRVVHGYFKQLLLDEKTDIVHIFHLTRLSASVIDACKEVGVPVVMTPTDFWLTCITCQLRMPDNSLCTGPSRGSVNCVKHIAQQNNLDIYERIVRKIPNWALGLATFFINRGINLEPHFSPEVRALVNRKSFLQTRMNQLDQLFLPTKIMQRMLVTNGLKEEKTRLLPFGINIDDEISNPPHQSGQKLVLGYVGTISEHKGVHVLIKAVHRLANKDIEVRIYGKSDDFPGYTAELRSIFEGDERIKFCGTFPNHEIGMIMSSLDALVVPSIWYENTPLVVYSAQAAGCPVIASDMPGIAEVIHDGVNGFLFEPGNVSALVLVLQKILHGEGILERLRQNAVKPMSLQEYTAEVMLSYHEIINKQA